MECQTAHFLTLIDALSLVTETSPIRDVSEYKPDLPDHKAKAACARLNFKKECMSPLTAAALENFVP